MHGNCLVGWGCLGKGRVEIGILVTKLGLRFVLGLGIILLALGERCMIGPDNVNKRSLDINVKCFVDVHCLCDQNLFPSNWVLGLLEEVYCRQESMT